MQTENRKAFESLVFTAIFICILWLVRLGEEALGTDFRTLGIFPRSVSGLPGIFTAPLIHGDNEHLMSNTLPLATLGIIILYFYRKIALEVVLWIYFLSGIWVWISATSDGYHLGASGLIYGLASFIFFSGIFRNDRKSITLSLLVTIVYGSMVWGIFPFYQNISWETHFFGALAGIMCAWYYRKINTIPKTGILSKQEGPDKDSKESDTDDQVVSS
ncbi:rhomboid family intramembrane serine protease [Cytophagaceae bacterium ABcell3]|nr:rhomboid family intramembrane serine protease [Cytophagaceae bacterium ABcell3]